MEFVGALKARGIELDPALAQRFDLEMVGAFAEFLARENERGGFFSKGDADRILERHVYESMVLVDYVARELDVSRETRVADIGSGPGLPGFLFACLRVPPYVVLADSSRRRLGLLEDWVKKDPHIAGHRMEFRYGRVEEFDEAWDVVVMRALIRFPHCVELVVNTLRLGGHAVYFGSAIHLAEREEKYLMRLGFVPRETQEPKELAFLGQRCIYYLTKTKAPAAGYPRKWARIQSEMKEWAQ